jgi:hypothetical protein
MISGEESFAMRSLRVISRPRLALATLALPLALAWFAGCDDKKSAVVEDKAAHGEAVTKNMESFMKNQPAQKPAQPKAQTK